MFASPFVVTLAACGGPSTPPPNPPQPQQDTAAPSATATTSSAPTASSAQATAEPKTWTIQIDHTKCSAMVDVTCPTGATCNPPPPSAYTCPKDVELLSYPLKVSMVAGSDQCQAKFRVYPGDGNCPPHVHCNPPPPHMSTITVPCPK